MMKLAYGEKKIVSSGPTPKSATIKDGNAIITFSKEKTNRAKKSHILSIVSHLIFVILHPI
jgi:hypothetical protein